MINLTNILKALLNDGGFETIAEYQALNQIKNWSVLANAMRMMQFNDKSISYRALVAVAKSFECEVGDVLAAKVGE